MWSVNIVSGARDYYNYCFIADTTIVTIMEMDLAHLIRVMVNLSIAT